MEKKGKNNILRLILFVFTVVGLAINAEAKSPKFHDFRGENFLSHIDSVIKNRDSKDLVSHEKNKNVSILSYQYKDSQNSSISYLVKFYFINNYLYYGEELTLISKGNSGTFSNIFAQHKQHYVDGELTGFCVETSSNKFCQSTRNSDVTDKYKIQYEVSLLKDDEKGYYIRETFLCLYK